VNFSANSITSSSGAFAGITYSGKFMPLIAPPMVSADAGVHLSLGQGINSLTFNGMAVSSSSVFIDMGPSDDDATVNVSNTSNYQGLTIDGNNGLNLMQVFDITGGATASIAGSRLHPLGAITVSYGNGSTSVINAVNFPTRQVFSEGKQIA